MLPFEASRRLTGANLFFAGPGAQLETSGVPVSDALLDAWRSRALRARAHLGWNEGGDTGSGPRAAASVTTLVPAEVCARPQRTRAPRIEQGIAHRDAARLQLRARPGEEQVCAGEAP